MLGDLNLVLLPLTIRIEHSVFAFVSISGGHVRVKVPDVGFIDTSVTKSSFVSTFVDDHSIFHIVSSVANDCYDSISSTGTQVKIILQVLSRADKGRLREKESVDLVVHAVGMTVVRRSHRLLRHLTLVHIPRTLIIVAEWNGGGYDR